MYRKCSYPLNCCPAPESEYFSKKLYERKKSLRNDTGQDGPVVAELSKLGCLGKDDEK